MKERIESTLLAMASGLLVGVETGSSLFAIAVYFALMSIYASRGK